MATRTTRTPREHMQINPHKIAATLAQLGSFATTYGCILALGGSGKFGFFVAVGIEFLLAAAKSLVFDGKKSSADAFGWIAIVVDTLLNAGGIWPGVLTLDKAPSWIMLKDSLGLDGDLSKLPALIVALVLGYLLSVAPHRLWRGGDS
jgi:hypothetical protein